VSGDPSQGEAPAGADVVVVGAGVIGLASAWKLAVDGADVVLVDPAPASGASFVAAGMLAPVGEALWGEEALLELNLRSVERWPGFVEELETATGLSAGYLSCGALLVGLDGSDRAALEDLHRFQRHLHLDVRWCPPAECRELEPLLAPGLRGGVLAAGDHQVDPQALLPALAAACERAGVRSVRASVEQVAVADGRAAAVTTAGGGRVAAGHVVIAAGCRSAGIAGLPPEAVPAVRPVKGQILELRGPADAPVLSRSVRGLVAGRSCYLVPRADGRVVLGATMEELGFDTRVTAGAIYELLRDAQRVLPAVAELELVATRAGLRPGSPDNAPIVGPTPVGGLVLATGHGRNGILLAPLTADLVASAVRGDPLPPWARACDPRRAGATRSAERAAPVAP
jgi:glycine oxidase